MRILLLALALTSCGWTFDVKDDQCDVDILIITPSCPVPEAPDSTIGPADTHGTDGDGPRRT